MKEKILPKIIVVCGLTATGKSDYAVKLAKKIGGEIISADSRQVYKGLNIGSGKITKKEMLGVPHYLLDVVSPKKVFAVSDFQKLAHKAIDKILSKGKTPIICGGTGFYIDSIVSGNVLPDVSPNKTLRKKLKKLSLQELRKQLKKLDSKRYKEIDTQNPVRLIRAIEIAEALGKVPEAKSQPKYNSKIIYLDFPNEVLKKRIHTRLLKRIKQGMISEVKNLHKNGVSWKRLYELGLEYRYISLFLQNQIPKDEMISKLESEIWHYAKKQRTWFKRYKI